MYPAEFIARFGKPVIKRYSRTVAESVKIPPDDNRCLFAIWYYSTPWVLYPDSSDGETFDPILLSSVQLPLVFTYTLHGSLPMMGFRLLPSAPPGSITTIEAFMRGGRRFTARADDAKSSQSNPQLHGNRGKSASVRRKPTPRRH